MNEVADTRNSFSADATILVVDDEPANLAVLNEVLQPYFRVRVVRSGADALRAVATEPWPDLMLLDVMMPEMDGYKVLARLREAPANRDLPVIFVTAMDSIENERRGLELGAVDYITKPISPAIVLARVRNQLELKRARDWLANQNAYLSKEVERRVQENQQAQLQLLQSEKLAAIGLLAAGLAHEINNPVCFVRSNLGSLAGYLQDLFDLLDAYGALEKSCPADALPSTIRDLKIRTDYAFIRQDCGQLISESQEGIGRVAQLVSDLKSFSRADDKQWRSVILHTGLDSTLNIIGNEIKYHCTLKKAYGNIPEVYCLPSQINQVFLNLLVNAAQAIPGKGEITITTGQAGSEVFVTIADTGAGIANEDLPRLFDPFFTTKPVGQGTGLGLSIAYGIVQKHLGRIDVKSTVGKGTTFTVWLPIKPSPATSSAE